jgi:hypothetical protein
MKVEIPKHSLHGSEAETIRTPKTPQNEGISWFESDVRHGLIQVYELTLEPDGGPNKDRAVSCVTDSNLTHFLTVFVIIIVHASSAPLDALRLASLSRSRHTRVQGWRVEDKLPSVRRSI